MSSVKEGEEIKLSAQVKDIADGNMVTFQVWKDGQDPAGASIPYAQLPVTVEGGAATAKWMHTYEGLGIPPAEDPKFFFTAHSAWCAMKKSSNATIELVRPELSAAEWGASEGLVGEELTLSVSAADFDEGKGVTFSIFAEGANTKVEEPVMEIGADIEGGTAEAVWIATEVREEGDTTELKYIFTATADKAEEVESSAVALKNPKVTSLEWDKEIVRYGTDVKLLIKTFETKELALSGKLQLWEKDATEEDSFLFEQDITLDKDEIEVEIKTEFDAEKLPKMTRNMELKICAKIICEPPITVCKSDILLVEFRQTKL